MRKAPSFLRGGRGIAVVIVGAFLAACLGTDTSTVGLLAFLAVVAIVLDCTAQQAVASTHRYQHVLTFVATASRFLAAVALVFISFVAVATLTVDFANRVGIDILEIVAFASMATAAVALVFTVQQARSQREHNCLSVKPYLTSCLGYYEDKDPYTFSLTIKNDGLGPALIKDFAYHTTDPAAKHYHSFRDFLLEKRPGWDNVSSWIGSLREQNKILKKGDALSANQEVILFEVRDQDKAFCEALEEFLRTSFRVRVLYESMYGEKLCLEGDLSTKRKDSGSSPTHVSQPPTSPRSPLDSSTGL